MKYSYLQFHLNIDHLAEHIFKGVKPYKFFKILPTIGNGRIIQYFLLSIFSHTLQIDTSQT